MSWQLNVSPFTLFRFLFAFLYSTASNNGAARMLKKLRTSKGDYLIKQ